LKYEITPAFFGCKQCVLLYSQSKQIENVFENVHCLAKLKEFEWVVIEGFGDRTSILLQGKYYLNIAVL